MSTKRRSRQISEPPKTRVISAEELVEWLRAKIGDEKHEAFAAEIGISRQTLSGILNQGKRLGPLSIPALKRYGMVGPETSYVVTEASCSGLSFASPSGSSPSSAS